MKKILLVFLCLSLSSCKKHGQLTVVPNTEELRDIICYQENNIKVCAGYYGGTQIQVEY